MDFLLSKNKVDSGWNSQSLGNYFIHFVKNHKISEREIHIETESYFIIGDANISFVEAIKKENGAASIEKNINLLRNGYVLFFDKRKSIINIYSDVFGFYHLFYIKKENSIVISSNFTTLLKYSNKKTDEFAIIDILLFNYTILDRTLISDIKRLKGGSRIILNKHEFGIETIYNFANNFILEKAKYKLKPKAFAKLLKLSLSRELIPNDQIQLTITAGFDSRALLAICKNLNKKISTFTFGQEGNIELEIAKTFINDFSQNHSFFKLDEKFISELPDVLDGFLKKNLDNPVILDLPQYSYIKDRLAPSNLILGFMGGEMLTGQSIGSQVTFTKVASVLLSSRSLDEFSDFFKSVIGELSFINKQHIDLVTEDYLQTLKEYCYQSDRTNTLKFLINESYSKFFGAVNKVYRNHSNLIVPFIDSDFINYILNSSSSFLYKKPFVQNPLANFKVKVFYAKFIKQMHPPLANTGFDRLYKVNDLCKTYRLPIAGIGYIQSHLFKKNKKNYPRPHHYDLWFKNIVTNQLNIAKLSKKSKLFNTSVRTNQELYSNSSNINKKRLAEVAAIDLSLNLINEN